MSKFARKQSEDSRLAIMEKSTAKEKKEIAARLVKKEKPAKPEAKKVKGKAPKAAKADKAPKAADTRKITLVTKDNPKRQGSAAHARYALYASNKTVEAFLKAGGTTEDLRFDSKAGHIKLA